MVSPQPVDFYHCKTASVWYCFYVFNANNWLFDQSVCSSQGYGSSITVNIYPICTEQNVYIREWVGVQTNRKHYDELQKMVIVFWFVFCYDIFGQFVNENMVEENNYWQTLNSRYDIRYNILKIEKSYEVILHYSDL